MHTEQPPAIRPLVHTIPPITPDYSVDQVGELLLSVPQYQKLLSLPVVDNGLPIGVISRYQLMDIFLKRFGRELYGTRRIHEFMNPEPILIDITMPLEQAAQYISQQMTFPVTEDFIITEGGEYRGIGMVLDLLRMMEEQVNRNSAELASAYTRLKESQTQLIQSEKMASLGQMVAGIAHEINTPLGYVHNNIELLNNFYGEFREKNRLYQEFARAIPQLIEQGDTESLQQVGLVMAEINSDSEFYEQVSTLFDDTLYGLKQISELVLNLKNFSRLDKAQVDDVSINDCVDSALLIGSNTLKYKATIEKDYGEVPPIPCSPSQLNQVFLNILTNAAQAIDEQGIIRVRTYADTDHVYVDIADSGRGIPPEHINRIFDPFFTTKKVGEGTGMGLSISYQIIERHRGKISVASAPGAGTTFTIQLPIRKAAVVVQDAAA